MRFLFILLIPLIAPIDSFEQQKSKAVTIFRNTNTPPCFKGGQSQWLQFVSNNFYIDSSCNDSQDLSELIVVQFIISEKGRINSIEVVKSADCLKDALINLIKLSEGKWIPATRHGKYITSYWRMQLRIHPQIQ